LLASGAGVSSDATLVSSLAGAVDGRAGGLAKLAWGGQLSAPATSHYIRASAASGRSVSPRVAALVNLEGLPVGLSVEVSLKTVGGAYTYQTQTVQTHRTPSGDICVLAMFDAGLDLCDGVEFTISNSSMVVDYDDEFSVGEIVLAGGLSFDLQKQWKQGVIDSAGLNVSKSGQLYLQPVPSGRSLKLRTSPQAFEAAVIGSDNLSALQMALADDPRCIAIADDSTQSRAEATCLYGYVSDPGPLELNAADDVSALFELMEMVGRTT
jgi:hypothetical protein